MIKTKRAYEPFSKTDGYRVLVDRLWPRGVSKEKLHLDEWAKNLAPSTELRKAFGHDPSKWQDFRSKYLKELKSTAARDEIKSILKRAKKKSVTLVYGARDETYNHAVVLKKVFERITDPVG